MKMKAGVSILSFLVLSIAPNVSEASDTNARINSRVEHHIRPSSPAPVVEAPVANPPAPQLVAAPRDEDEVLQKAARN